MHRSYGNSSPERPGGPCTRKTEISRKSQEVLKDLKRGSRLVPHHASRIFIKPATRCPEWFGASKKRLWGRRNRRSIAMPRTKITWLARFIGSRTTTGPHIGPDFTQLPYEGTPVSWDSIFSLAEQDGHADHGLRANRKPGKSRAVDGFGSQRTFQPAGKNAELAKKPRVDSRELKQRAA
jgi:hypothetical protein